MLLFDLLNESAFLFEEEIVNGRVRLDLDVFLEKVVIQADALNSPNDFIADSGMGLDVAFATAVGACIAQRLHEAFSNALAGHFH